jgi:2-polyprenyl-3-methyl-5-hydroxy-6-metoxy-1,4-benzoquinol methylase
MATPIAQQQPNPAVIFETLNAYMRTAALKSAIQLDLFTSIGEGNGTSAALAGKCGITERGARILCDYLTISGLLAKADGVYALTRDSAVFLDRRSPACIGSIADFLTLPTSIEAFMNLTETLRSGGVNLREKNAADPDNPIWLEFAHAMKPLMIMPANEIAAMLDSDAGEQWKVLDIAAGHGMFGITIAEQNPNAQIFALDSVGVLKIARENAEAAGITSRYHLLPGDAFNLELGSSYNVILLTNFLHHFDMPTIEPFLRKVHAALAPGGRVVTLEFVPNNDRVTPPITASFSMVMLGQTVGGDAYTFVEFERMFRNAGFSSSALFAMPGPESVIISYK